MSVCVCVCVCDISAKSYENLSMYVEAVASDIGVIFCDTVYNE